MEIRQFKRRVQKNPRLFFFKSFTISTLLIFGAPLMHGKRETKFREAANVHDHKYDSAITTEQHQTIADTDPDVEPEIQLPTNKQGYQNIKGERRFQENVYSSEGLKPQGQPLIDARDKYASEISGHAATKKQNSEGKLQNRIQIQAEDWEAYLPKDVTLPWTKMQIRDTKSKKGISISKKHTTPSRGVSSGLSKSRNYLTQNLGKMKSSFYGKRWFTFEPKRASAQELEDQPQSIVGSQEMKLTQEMRMRKSESSSRRKYEPFVIAEEIRHIHIIPGSGEFVYDTKIQTRMINGIPEPINHNSKSKESDAVLSLNQLQEDLPNVEWVSVLVNWFGNHLNIKYCEVYPAVEFQDDSVVLPDGWQVKNIDRSHARLISRNEQGNPRFAGTVSDAALVRFIHELHDRGYNVMLYPMLLLDTKKGDWRGKLTGPWRSISNFFTGQYNSFIKHYSNIAKLTGVEAFLIGSDLVELTKIQDDEGNFPAVSELSRLARFVKTRLGAAVTVTYGADWTEYHSRGGVFNMDELWSSNFIDVVGINAYFPLTDESQPPSGFSREDVIYGWSSGEGYDYYLDYSKNPPQKTAYLNNKWAWKNIEKWWSEAHVNIDGSKTNWRPKMKKIWFTEYGFPSVDGCTNEPYVFINGGNKESRYPRHSRKELSLQCQRTAIEGTLKKWQGVEMVEKMFLWAWDARPFPFFPNLNNVWGDCKNWKTGHWIQGKIGKIRSWRRHSIVEGRPAGLHSPL